jgi:four helix bundle protein
MGRLRQETLDRAEHYSNRMLDVVEALEKQGRWRRVTDQMAGAGTSVGANVFECDEAMTAKDFAKTLGIVVKELNENRFWLRLCARRAWIKPRRLEPLIEETRELKSIFGAMIVRTRRAIVKPQKRTR